MNKKPAETRQAEIRTKQYPRGSLVECFFDPGEPFRLAGGLDARLPPRLKFDSRTECPSRAFEDEHGQEVCGQNGEKHHEPPEIIADLHSRIFQSISCEDYGGSPACIADPADETPRVARVGGLLGAFDDLDGAESDITDGQDEDRDEAAQACKCHETVQGYCCVHKVIAKDRFD